MTKLIYGCKAASELTGIPVRRFQRLITSRKIRFVHLANKTYAFVPDHLERDLAELEQPKRR
jgi:hypothetical protein